MISVAPVVVDWIKATSDSGKTGFAKRMLTVQDNPGSLVELPASIINAYNDLIYADFQTV